MNFINRNRNIFDYLRRKITRKYLKKICREHIKERDQLILFSYDFISQSIFMDGRFEDCELTLIENIFKDQLKNKITLDIGANIGNHTVVFSKFSHKVYSFEPNPKVFEVLKLNTKDLKNVEIFNFGASSKKQSMHAKIPKLNCGGGSVSNEEAGEKDSNSYYEFSFDLIALDTFKNIPNEDIGLVKIDVEGHELEAFKGMKSLLEKNKPVILFEQNRGITDGSSNEIEFLKNIGYKHLYELKKIEDWVTPKFLPKTLKSFMRLIEVLILGEPSSRLKLSPISKLTKKKYDMLIFTSERIDT